MLSYAKNYFGDCRLARMSNGEYCLIRDQGPVKGGRGLKHHETLIVFSIRGLAANIVNLRKKMESASAISFFGNALRRLVTGQRAQCRISVIRIGPDDARQVPRSGMASPKAT